VLLFGVNHVILASAVFVIIHERYTRQQTGDTIVKRCNQSNITTRPNIHFYSPEGTCDDGSTGFLWQIYRDDLSIVSGGYYLRSCLFPILWTSVVLKNEWENSRGTSWVGSQTVSLAMWWNNGSCPLPSKNWNVTVLLKCYSIIYCLLSGCYLKLLTDFLYFLTISVLHCKALQPQTA